MSWIDKLLPPQIQPSDPTQRKSVPEGLWVKCVACESVLYRTDVEANLFVCPKCNHHMRIRARVRLEHLLDQGGRYEIGQEVLPVDSLKFKDTKKYPDRLKDAMDQSSPDSVIHMAAQPLVRYSYANPIETYTTNVMGTVNVLECVRNLECVKAVVIVTTDKCYENREWDQGYVESDAMGGFDPYSSSKGCAELVTAAYRQSYFSDNANGLKAAIASARAGNVIGGGDWSQDRLVPDAIKAFEENKSLLIRNPNATRPWQHVLEPLSGYLILAQALYEQGRAFSGAWNFGPADQDAVPVKAVIECLIHSWPEKANWQQDGGPHPHEAHFLKLNCNKAKEFLQWAPRWHVNEAIEKIVAWQMAHRQNKSMRAIALEQITQYSQSPSH